MKNSPSKRTNFHQSNYGSGTLEILNRLYRIENIKYFADLDSLQSKIEPYTVHPGLKLANRRSDYEVKDRIRMKIIYGIRIFALWAKMALIRKVLWLAVLWDKHRFHKNVTEIGRKFNHFPVLRIKFRTIDFEIGNGIEYYGNLFFKKLGYPYTLKLAIW